MRATRLPSSSTKSTKAMRVRLFTPPATSFNWCHEHSGDTPRAKTMQPGTSSASLKSSPSSASPSALRFSPFFAFSSSTILRKSSMARTLVRGSPLNFSSAWRSSTSLAVASSTNSTSTLPRKAPRPWRRMLMKTTLFSPTTSTKVLRHSSRVAVRGKPSTYSDDLMTSSSWSSLRWNAALRRTASLASFSSSDSHWLIARTRSLARVVTDLTRLNVRKTSSWSQLFSPSTPIFSCRNLSRRRLPSLM
mmetsp:Transcript_14512/g.36741  ORF Transcript_14512/g.36741 Transcript_14512/m.36741 type:complete len:248 (-) Transcript_14512:402-1145(-)